MIDLEVLRFGLTILQKLANSITLQPTSPIPIFNMTQFKEDSGTEVNQHKEV